MPAFQNVCLPWWHDIWAFLSWFPIQMCVPALLFFFALCIFGTLFYCWCHYCCKLSVESYVPLLVRSCVKYFGSLFACVNYYFPAKNIAMKQMSSFLMFFLTVTLIKLNNQNSKTKERQWKSIETTNPKKKKNRNHFGWNLDGVGSLLKCCSSKAFK